jgi:hypothetical protein
MNDGLMSPINNPDMNSENDEIQYPQNPEYYLKKIHGGRKMHWGIRRTWLLLNKYFPGHRIPYQVVSDFVKECPTCQKNRLEMTEGIKL